MAEGEIDGNEGPPDLVALHQHAGWIDDRLIRLLKQIILKLSQLKMPFNKPSMLFFKKKRLSIHVARITLQTLEKIFEEIYQSKE